MLILELNKYRVTIDNMLRWTSDEAPWIAETLNRGLDFLIEGYTPDRQLALAQAAIKLYKGRGRIIEHIPIDYGYEKGAVY